MLTHEQKVKTVYYLMKNRLVHPEGTFDKAGRWYPDNMYECCSDIRGPSRSYPYSYMLHCRTKKHIDTVLNNDPNFLSYILSHFDKEEIPLMINETHTDFFKGIIKDVLEGKFKWLN